MKRLIIGFAVLALLAGGASMAFGREVSAAALESPAPSLVIGRVTAYGLNVRSGPGTAYPIVGGLSRGDSVEVVGKNATDDWLQIVYNGQGEFNGQRAWIAAAYVDPVENGEWRRCRKSPLHPCLHPRL
jgi:uncharacterized protein YraI